MSLQGKNVAVIGMGISGVASARLASAQGAKVFAVNSGNVEDWASKVHDIPNCTPVGQDDSSLEETLLNSELIVLSPGIARESSFLVKILEKGISVISEIELAYRSLDLSSTKIISVTGTNGKTTTVTLIDILARGAGKDVFLGGNIGTPFASYALEVLKEKRSPADVIILELSSFQLESMVHFKSDVAAILNISENHGERYNEVIEYAVAKFNIADRMSLKDTIYIGDLGGFEKDFNPNCKIEFLKTPLSLEKVDPQFVGKFHLIGEHNLSNLNFSISLLENICVDWKKGIEELSKFHGVHYRLQKRPSRKGLEVFNDAKSTNWEATTTALKASVFSFPDIEINLILGGQLRGHGDELGNKLDSFKSNIKKLYLFGESGKSILKEERVGFSYEYFDNLDEVIKSMKDLNKNEVILFSPAFPSFDLYDNYIRRGEHFDRLVNEYLGL